MWEGFMLVENTMDDLLGWKLISKLSRETLALLFRSPRAVLCLHGDLTIVLLLLFLLILRMYHVYVLNFFGDVDLMH